MTEKEIETRVDFLSSAKCNHTPHKYIDITGDLIQGTLLARILYWFAEDKNKQRKVRIFKDGYFWIAKQRKDWWEEIRISERQYDKAIKGLEEKGFVVLAKYKFNSMPTIHIRPDYDNINDAVEKWEDELRKEIVKESNEELQDCENGNNTKCKSQGNDAKCKTGITQESNLLTDITNSDYSDKDYITDTTKEKGENINKVNAEVKTSVSEKKPMHTQKTAKQRYLDKKADEFEMLNSILLICSSGYDEQIGNEIFRSLEHYFERYTQKTGLIHPILKYETLEDIIDKMANYSDTEYYHFENIAEQEGAFIKIIDAFFGGDFGSATGQRTNWHLPHFMSDGVLDRLTQRLWEAGEVY